MVWEAQKAQIARRPNRKAKMTRSVTNSDWVSEEWSNDSYPPVSVGVGDTPCHFRLLGGLSGLLGLPDHPKGPTWGLTNI